MKCFLCGCQATDRHHIFGGANRAKSEKDGLVVMLCRKCHNELHFGLHSQGLMTKLRKYGQLKWEWEHPCKSFSDRYGYNYLDDDDRKAIQPGTDIIPLDELIKELEVK